MTLPDEGEKYDFFQLAPLDTDTQSNQELVTFHQPVIEPIKGKVRRSLATNANEEYSHMSKRTREHGVFFAFASQPEDLGATIGSGIKMYRDRSGEFDIMPWTDLKVSGELVWKKILSEIDHRPFFLADVSTLNPNVTYEMGYAIGRERKLRFVLNNKLKDDSDRSNIGIFDVLGYQPYNSDEDLFKFIHSSLSDSVSLFVDKGLDTNAPIFLFDAFEKSELINHIKTCVKKYLIRFRSYDPQEQARLPVHEAIRQVAISEGVVVSLVQNNYAQATTHNYRAAFVAGLSHGMGKELRIVQLGDEETPLDFREHTDLCFSKDQIESAISKFTLAVTPRLQRRVHKASSTNRSLLEQLDLGGSVAENELQTIDDYYLETDAYQHTLRGEVRLIIGRKGAGKTALFLRVRNEKRRRKKNIVLDLKPEGYKLLKFKELIVDALSEGSLHHVVSAIWEYVLLLELAYKLLENDKDIYSRNANLVEKYDELKAAYEQDDYYSKGDFSERVSVLLDEIGAKIKDEQGFGQQEVFRQRRVSELIYKHPINRLMAAVANYLCEKNEAWILVDNLDKGWPGTGVSQGDVSLISCLLEALEKMERSFRQKGFDRFFSTVFLRADVYENLIDVDSDRGKIFPVSVDWTDSEALKEVLRKRFVCSDFNENLSLDRIWSEIAVPSVAGINSLDFLLGLSLFRPRALLDLLATCRSTAVNRRHKKISESDITESAKRSSIRMIENVNLELRDISPKFDRLLYEFVGIEPSINREKLRKILRNFAKESKLNQTEKQVVDLLLWFGFFGIESDSGDAVFIFDVDYNMNMIRAISDRRRVGARFVVHPTFRPGLSIVEQANVLQTRWF